ncbi:hypothetical protein [Butyrivibrio sp. YAB3001]|uniref:hypothetical protein n=1 Tax=Butyrivibrio sp. YAB3001 TaxID=1520812 RepID=UPI0008F6805C|nr:hypothetical protein [Butyrivibrio sp. YAB3001]SFC27216.1 hypothetical protein SAMN02910398_01864 [Butyrivibrio sp. YAB3001]
MIRHKNIFRKIKYSLGALASVSMLTLSTLGVQASDGTSYVYDGYIYDTNVNVVDSPAAFSLEKVINSESTGGITFQGIDDVCTSADGRIFLSDKKSGRVNVFDSEGNYLQSIKTIWTKEGTIKLDESGNQITLKGPEGCYAHDKTGELYVADAQAGCVIVLDLEDYTYLRTITKPTNMTGSTEFKPSKVAVDEADRIFIVVQSSYEGIIELANDGSFIGYYGVNVPSVNLIDYFWKSLATDEQKAQMGKTLAPAFNNVAIDGEGFVMAVTYDSAATDMIFRLNSKGENVVREEGNTYLKGDVRAIENPSQFVDLAVTDYGVFAALDQQRGRIFIYDFDGEQLIAFGSLGNLKGEFKTPTGISWLGQKLVVTDSTLECAYILAPTSFGKAMLSGSEEYYRGNWDAALGYFEQAVKYNANYEVGYVGIGKNYLMKDEYEKALYYFKLGGARKYYSKAYYGYRGLWLRAHFRIIAVIFVVLIGLLIWSEIKYNRAHKVKA